tara:strand:+ start:2020 stop:2412 length:393 start_codon:yes stop_codon:yes gene_type:complete
MRYFLVLITVVLVSACDTVGKSKSDANELEIANFEANYKISFTDAAELSDDKKRLKLSFRCPDHSFKPCLERHIKYLDFPDEIAMEMDNYRPIDGLASWEYRDVKMRFSMRKINWLELGYYEFSILLKII